LKFFRFDTTPKLPQLVLRVVSAEVGVADSEMQGVAKAALLRLQGLVPEVAQGPGLAMELVSQSQVETGALREFLEWQVWEAVRLRGPPMEKFRSKSSV